MIGHQEENTIRVTPMHQCRAQACDYPRRKDRPYPTGAVSPLLDMRNDLGGGSGSSGLAAAIRLKVRGVTARASLLPARSIPRRVLRPRA